MHAAVSPDVPARVAAREEFGDGEVAADARVQKEQGEEESKEAEAHTPAHLTGQRSEMFAAFTATV